MKECCEFSTVKCSCLLTERTKKDSSVPIDAYATSLNEKIPHLHDSGNYHHCGEILPAGIGAAPF